MKKIGSNLSVRPLSIKEANKFVERFHRHHRPTTNNRGKWAVSAVDYVNGQIVGVAIAGNPVSASFMDGSTVEVLRLCVSEIAPMGSCSFLLACCCRVWKEMGGKRLITYTLSTESGASLRGAGWQLTAISKGHQGWTRKSKSDGRHRENLAVYELTKHRWERNVG